MLENGLTMYICTFAWKITQIFYAINCENCTEKLQKT